MAVAPVLRSVVVSTRPVHAAARGSRSATPEDLAVDAGFARQVFGRLWRDRLSLVAAGVLVLLVVLAAAADLLATHVFRVGPTEQDLLRAYARPELHTPALWLGADELGRSQVVRLAYAARVSLAVGFGAALVNRTLGLTLGLLAGTSAARSTTPSSG